MEELRKKARMYGACDIQKSTRKNKKWVVDYCGKRIHFGQKGASDFLQHKDKKRRDSYLKRARGIRNKEGRQTYRDKTSPNFWSYWIL